MHGAQSVDSDVTEGINKVEGHRRSLSREIIIMFRRSITLIIRDPILYLGRCLVFLISNCFFAFVYWNARSYTQDQAFNKVWISIWIIAVPSNMGVVAVYALNDEFKSILRETKNGMVSPISYILAKTILVIPIMFVFAIFGLGIPAFVIQDFAGAAFGRCIVLWAALIYVFECAAECFAVLFDDPILGMMQFMNIWFGAFLFGGFLIPLRDMYWPFELFYYIFPYSYYVRSFIHTVFTSSEWEACTVPTETSVCINSTDGKDVLLGLKNIFPLIETEDRFFLDLGIVLAIAVFWKLLAIVVILIKTRKVANIDSDNAPRAATEAPLPRAPRAPVPVIDHVAGEEKESEEASQEENETWA